MLKHFLFYIDVEWPVARIKLTDMKHLITQNMKYEIKNNKLGLHI